MRRAFLIGLCGALAGLAGCDLAPNYAPPAIAVPEHYKTAPPAGPIGEPADAWWRDFRSAELDRLEARVEPDNPDYAAALARYQRAMAVLDLAQSAF